MAESRQHKQLVQRIVSYVEAKPDCCADFIEADLENYNTRTTRVVGGFYPDVFYKDAHSIYIGEAKTEQDLINLHTTNQLLSYVDEVKLFNGERHIILCVPFFAFCTLYNYINRFIEQHNISNICFHLISDTSRAEILCL